MLSSGNRVAVSLQNTGETYIYSPSYDMWYRSWDWNAEQENITGVTAIVTSENRLMLTGGQRENDPNDLLSEVYEFSPIHDKRKVGDLETARNSMAAVVLN